nr:MAG TPA: hypothetical protein [Caudoviricetes sp.]
MASFHYLEQYLFTKTNRIFVVRLNSNKAMFFISISKLVASELTTYGSSDQL